MRIANIFDKDEPRAGDRFAGPALYFDFPGQFDLVSCRKVDEIDLGQYDLIILGGGGLLHIPFPEYDNGRFLWMEKFIPYAQKVVTWGMGHNVHGSQKIEYPEYMDKFALNGVRDRGQRFQWVPCASCCHNWFSIKHKIVDAVRVFRRDDPNGIFVIPEEKIAPTMLDAHGQSFEEIIEFLAGGETIVTNSYHGAYWSMLLGKTVLIYLHPIASKFFGLLGIHTWLKNRNYLMITPEIDFLNHCREVNKNYYKQVLNILEK
jgi:hypothetical protein